MTELLILAVCATVFVYFQDRYIKNLIRQELDRIILNEDD